MNTITKFEALVDEFRFKLDRDLDEREVNFLRWVESRQCKENQWKRTGKFYRN